MALNLVRTRHLFGHVSALSRLRQVGLSGILLLTAGCAATSSVASIEP
jgi:hypothetical protein